jgi:hypothetical protein
MIAQDLFLATFPANSLLANGAVMQWVGKKNA